MATNWKPLPALEDIGAPRRRGRPAVGLAIAQEYNSQVQELIKSCLRPTAAVREVAARTGRTENHEMHIWHCMRMVKKLDAEAEEWVTEGTAPELPELSCFVSVRRSSKK